MGLDIAFNRELAIKAGLEVITEKNDGTLIEDPVTDMDRDYNEWCTRIIELIKVPNCSHYVENTGIEDIVVRANQWGNTYAPLTDWLRTHNIEWYEF